MVRGGSFVVAIDLAGRRYAKLPLEEGSGDYNDFLASTHMGTRAVTYCNVDYTPIGRSTASSAFGNRRRKGALACPRSGREGSREDLCAPSEERGR